MAEATQSCWRAGFTEIQTEIETTTSDYDRDKLQERLAKLAGGVAVVKVGGATEIAMKERKLRVEDALHSVRAALDEGVVAGGRRSSIPRRGRSPTASICATRTSRLACGCCAAQSRSRCAKSPPTPDWEPSVIGQKVREGQGNFGFNAATEEYGDMIEMGILDPCKVTRLALQNAASVASLMITTEAVVAPNVQAEE